MAWFVKCCSAQTTQGQFSHKAAAAGEHNNIKLAMDCLCSIGRGKNQAKGDGQKFSAVRKLFDPEVSEGRSNPEFCEPQER